MFPRWQRQPYALISKLWEQRGGSQLWAEVPCRHAMTLNDLVSRLVHVQPWHSRGKRCGANVESAAPAPSL